MNENHYGESSFATEEVAEQHHLVDGELQTESSHPVLQQLKNRIAELETQLSTQKETANSLDADRVMTIGRIRNEKTQREERIKNVLVEALEDHDEDTVKWIANNLDIELTVRSTYEVNVTFTIEVDHEVGNEPDPEWDFEFEVTHSDIEDYQSDVIWSKKA